MAVFGVLGGDRRQLYLARSLEEDGHTLFLHGLEGLAGAAAFPTLPLEELGRRCPVVVLPLPAVREGSFLNAPFARAPIPLDDSFAAALAHCLVLGGMVGKLRQTSPLWETIPLEDYYQREELTVGNAFLTAEGALALAVEHAPGALGALGVWWRALGALARRCAWICAPWAPRWTAPPASPGIWPPSGPWAAGPSPMAR